MNYRIKFFLVLGSFFISNARLSATISKTLEDRDFLTWVNENNPAYLLEPLSSEGFQALIRAAELEQLRKERLKLERAYFARQAQNSIEFAMARPALTSKAPNPITKSPPSVTERISPLVAASILQEQKESKEFSPKTLIKNRFKKIYKDKILLAAIAEAQRQENLGALDVRDEGQEDLFEIDNDFQAIAASLQKANEKIAFYAECCIGLNRAESQLRRNLSETFREDTFGKSAPSFKQAQAKNIVTKEFSSDLKKIVVKLTLMQSAFDLNREKCLKLDVKENEAKIIDELDELVAATAKNYKQVSDRLRTVLDIMNLAQGF